MSKVDEIKNLLECVVLCATEEAREHFAEQLEAAIDAQQAEIDRLRSDAIRALAAGGVLVRLGRIDDYADVCDELVFTDAMAECTWPSYELLQPEPQERGDKPTWRDGVR